MGLSLKEYYVLVEFCDFGFGGKSPNLRKRGFLLVLTHFWSCFGLDSMVGYEIYEFRVSYLRFVGGKRAKSAITGQNPRIGTST